MTDSRETCFVISPFGEPFDTYFEAVIKPSIESNGLFAVRGDSLYRPTTIVDDIWSEINAATILVAELTGRSPNVFYELGLAHAISKPVVLLSQSIDDVPFDLRSIRVILYDKDHPEWGDRLKQALIRSIKEVLNSPGSAIPSTFKSLENVGSFTESAVLSRIDALENTVRILSQSTSPTPSNSLQLKEFSDEDYEKRGPFVKLSLGDRVIHRNYGQGIVVSADNKHPDREINYEINFDRYGVKHINQWIARMQPLADP